MTSKPVVLSVGARSPLGLSALQTSLVWRAGKLAPFPLPWLDKRGTPASSVRARCVGDDVVGASRLVALAAPALRDAARAAGERAVSAPLLLATAESRPGFELAPRLDTALAIAREAGVRVDAARSSVVGLGHAGFGFVLQRAVELLGAPGAGPVIVGAVDSYHAPECVAWLDEECRLHGDGVPNGIIPSEGAAFLVLGPPGLPGVARLASVACALEDGHEEGAAPDLGRALSDAVRRAAADAPERPVPWVLTDVNGERHRVRRWSFVRVRDPGIVCPDATLLFDGPDELGDAGAAVGALLAAHACVGFVTGHAGGRRSALVALSSEGRERSAFVLEAA